MNRSIAATVALGVVGWAATLGGLRLFIVQPELCGSGDVAELRDAATATVGWFDANQLDDGTWLYRFDRDEDVDLGGYNIVRHAGVTMSLEQAASAGFDDAAEIAERGLEWALANLYEGPGFVAMAEPGDDPKVGATGLLVAALVERRDRTGDTAHDEVMNGLGAFLTAHVTDRGQVLGGWDIERGEPVPRSWNKFYTGEAFWALALLHRTFPDKGYDDTARRIADYLATDRDDHEGWWPDVPDHWAAYGFAVMTTWPDGDGLTDAHRAYARKQMQFQSMQIRWESQRTNSFLSHYTRGRQTLAAGLGTIGEALTNWSRVAAADPAFESVRDDVAERTLCVAGTLTGRQATGTGDDRIDGAWFQFGVTQMDDQQHALSALLGGIELADDGEVSP